MRVCFGAIAALVALACAAPSLRAQDLTPRAYVITPVHCDAVIAHLHLQPRRAALRRHHTDHRCHRQLQRSRHQPLPHAELLRTLRQPLRLPALWCRHIQGCSAGQANLDLPLGFARRVLPLLGQLAGGTRPCPVQEFTRWKQKTLLGVSLRVIAPTGQYDGTKLVNWGINRWAFKPELGYSRRLGKWLLDGYGGVWLYTTNSAAFAGPFPKPQTQGPIGSLEGHLSYDFGRRSWVSLDGNFWWGGITSLSGVTNLASKQVGSRLGGTGSLRLSPTIPSKSVTAAAPTSASAATTRMSPSPGNIPGPAARSSRIPGQTGWCGEALRRGRLPAIGDRPTGKLSVCLRARAVRGHDHVCPAGCRSDLRGWKTARVPGSWA